MSTPTQNPHEVVAEEVRALLARRRISGRAAARDLGWKSDYMWRRLDGRTAFDVNDLVALAGLLDVPITAFFSGIPWETKERLSPTGKSRLTLTCTYVPPEIPRTSSLSRLAA